MVIKKRSKLTSNSVCVCAISVKVEYQKLETVPVKHRWSGIFFNNIIMYKWLIILRTSVCGRRYFSFFFSSYWKTYKKKKKKNNLVLIPVRSVRLHDNLDIFRKSLRNTILSTAAHPPSWLTRDKMSRRRLISTYLNAQKCHIHHF